MNQCVPSWDLDNNIPTTTTHEIHNKLMLDKYEEVAELTWKGGHIDMHGFDQPRAVPANSFPSAATRYAWGKTRASGTLECIVDGAIAVPKIKLPTINLNNDNQKLVSLFENHRSTDSACGGTDSGRDALVPSSNGSCNDQTITVSSSYGGTREWSNRGSQDVTVDTWDTYWDVNSASEAPQGNTNYAKSSCNDSASTDDQYDSVYRSRRQDKKKRSKRYSVSNKRSRAAAIHNQSERKRRDRINQRIKTLQKMVPNSNKTDKASMLDEVIEYLKQLQAQLNMMKMNMSPLMLQIIMQQKQLQMSMMMASIMGIGRLNSMNGISPVFYPTPFNSMSSWGASDDQLVVPMINPLSAYAACQSQQIMEAYSRMAALFQ